MIGPKAGVPGGAEVLGSRMEWARAGQRLWRWGRLSRQAVLVKSTGTGLT